MDTGETDVFPLFSPSIMERTFVALKPDGVQRGLCGEVMKRFEQKGFRLVAAKFLQVTMATETRSVVVLKKNL